MSAFSELDPDIRRENDSAYIDNTKTIVKAQIPTDIWIDARDLINVINTLTDIKRVALYLAQIPVQPATWTPGKTYPTRTNQLLVLFYFINKKGEFINDLAYDFENGNNTYNQNEVQYFFSKYKESNGLYEMLEKVKANNTRIIHFPVTELSTYLFKYSPELRYIKLLPSEIDAYSKPVLKDPFYRSRFTNKHKQFNFTFEFYDAMRVRIGTDAYDINSLCPPECDMS